MQKSELTIELEMERLHNQLQSTYQELLALKRGNPHSVEDYTFIAPDGAEIRLSDLFGDKNDLILIHNMGSRCPYCTLWGDGFNGVYHHMSNRASFYVVSPEAPDIQRAFAESRGWKFPMISDQATDFTRAMGYLFDNEGKSWWMPGVSVFSRSADGAITRVAKDVFGPGDPYCSVWPMFDLLADGPGTWQPSINYTPTEVLER